MDSPLGVSGDLRAVSWSSFALRYAFAQVKFTGVPDPPKFVLLHFKGFGRHISFDWLQLQLFLAQVKLVSGFGVFFTGSNTFWALHPSSGSNPARTSVSDESHQH
jgi:hypothetical protein